MLPKFSVNKPYTIIVAVILIIILGFTAYSEMTPDLLPSIDLPYAVVVTSYVGATPEEVELTITKPVEEVLATISNVKNLMSYSAENMSMVIMEFHQETNMDSATLEMRENLDLISSYWTDEKISSPMIIKLNPDMMPAMVATVTIKDSNPVDTTKFVDDNLLSAFESLEGIAAVTSIGFVAEEINVNISKDKINSLNDRINSAIDGNIEEARSALNSARSQLGSAAAELQQQTKQQQTKLDEASTQLAQGEAALKQSSSDIDSAVSQLKEQQQDLTATLKTLQLGKSTLQQQEQQLLALGDSITVEQKNQLQYIQQSISELDSQISELQASLDIVNGSLEEALSAQNSIDQQQQELDKQKQTLTEAQQTLNSEVTKAQAEISSGQSQIEQQSASLEEQAESAKDEAAINNIISAEMISGILAAQNFSMPAGSLDDAENNYTVKIGNKITSLDELKNLELFKMDLDDIGAVTINDVADVNITNNSDLTYAKINGEDGVILSFQKQSNYSTTEVCDLLNAKFSELEKQYESLSILPLMDQGSSIHIITNSVLKNLLFGAVLAIIVLFLFLRNIRPTIIIAISIPASILFAIVMMYFTGVTINVISLGGLALGVGMLVDNSIVVIENIYRMRDLGKSAKESAIEGAKQVAAAITASTLTTISVFIPILFTNGLAKELFIDMGLTIAYSLFASLLVSLSLVPAISSGIFKNMDSREGRFFNSVKSKYANALGWALRHRALCLIATILLFAGSIAGAFAAGISLLPESDSLELSATVSLTGDEATKENLWAASDEVTAKIMEIDDISAVGAFQTGDESSYSMNSGEDTSMSFYILLDENKTRSNKEIAKDIKDRCADLNCEVDVSSEAVNLSALGGSGISINVKGDDMYTLQSVAGDVSSMLTQIKGVENVSDPAAGSSPELLVSVNKNKAIENNLTIAQIYSTVAEALETSSSATTVSIDGHDYSVKVSDDTIDKITADNLSKVVLVEGDDDSEDITVGDIASIEQKDSALAISRLNQQRYITVTASVADGYNVSKVANEVQKKLDQYDLPEGFSTEISGESETTKTIMIDLLKAVGLAAVLIYLIMVAQFQSLLYPFIIIFTVPLAFTGGFLALLITGFDVSIIAMIGILILSGIIVNNGIVLVDYINRLRSDGLDVKSALITGGSVRMRPILMTAMTTVLGLLTLSLGIGMGSEILQPMAIVTIGGLIFGTFTTLFIVPVIYDLLQKKSKTDKNPTEIGNSEPNSTEPDSTKIEIQERTIQELNAPQETDKPQ